MNLFDLNNNIQNLVRMFSQFVWNMAYFLVWATIGLASIAATYVVARTIIVAAQHVLRAIGIDGGM